MEKKGRGRPRKIKPEPVIEPATVIEPTPPSPPPEAEVPQPMRTVVEESTGFTNMHYLNGSAIDLSDIAKAEPEPEPEPPVFNTPNFNYSPISQPAQPSESAEDYKERRALISKIGKYKKEFEFANSIVLNEDAPLHQIRTQLDEIRMLIQNKTTGILIKRTYLTSVSTLELVGKKTNVAKLNGLTDLLSRSAEVDECLKLISCELDLGYISPYKKLAFITLSSAYVLHTLNAKAEIFTEFGKTPANPNVTAQYADL